MPLPLPARAALVVTPLVTALLGKAVYDALREKAEKKTLAVIGESRSGKTTFTQYLATAIVGEDEYARTVADTKYRGATFTYKDGTKLHVGDLVDVPGEESAWLSWKRRVGESDYVLYLIRSHDLRAGRSATVDRCRRDLKQLRLWLREMEPEDRPSVLMVFSFRDQDPDHTANTTAYADDIIMLSGLKAVVDSLCRETRVDYVSGCMADTKRTEKLVKQIGDAL